MSLVNKVPSNILEDLMSRKLSALILACSLTAALSGCKTAEKPAEPNGSQPAAATAPNQSVTSLNSGTITPTSATFGNTDKPVAHPGPMLHNAVAGEDVTLPSDVPVFPKAELAGKRVTNAMHIFDFKASADVNEVIAFYNSEMKNQQWSPAAQQSNSSDGLLFKKPNRLVRVIATKNGKDKSSEIHLFVSEVQKAVDKSDPISTNVGNIGDMIKMPKSIPTDVPVYDNSQRKVSAHPRMWYEYRSKDSVDTIASWYTKKMAENGWSVELDTSELGDSYRIFQKDDGKGNKRKIGIRVNDMKKEQERWLTLVLLPDNIVVPPVKSMSDLKKVQGSAATSIEDAYKKAHQPAPAQAQPKK
jgi:hypothetical protein